MGNRLLPLRLGLLTGLSGLTGWLLLAPHPLPFGISIQREIGFVGHVSLFAIITLAYAAAFPRVHRRVATTLLAVAISLETAQLFIPTRGADFADVVMNCTGILLGLVAFRTGAALLTVPHQKTTGKPCKMDISSRVR